jgi:hypothetical protein
MGGDFIRVQTCPLLIRSLEVHQRPSLSLGHRRPFFSTQPTKFIFIHSDEFHYFSGYRILLKSSRAQPDLIPFSSILMHSNEFILF